VRIAGRIRKLINGKTTFVFRGFLYKCVLRRTNICQLQRECSYSNLAQRSALFAGHVVSAEFLSPRLIRYPLISTSNAVSERVQAMIDFGRQIKKKLQHCPTQKASIVLENYCVSLDVNLQKFYEQNRLQLSRLQFDLPVSFMHGDFGPSNTGLRGNSLAMFDWEFAYEKGSLLYDFWYLDHICRFKQYPDKIVENTGEFVASVITEYGVHNNSFRYFCHLVNALQGCKK